MSDIPLQQERRKIEPQEIGKSAPKPTIPFDQIQAYQKSMGMEVHQDNTPSIPNNLPPALQQILKKQQEESYTEQMETTRREIPQMSIMNTGSSALDELIGGISNLQKYEPVTLPSGGKFYTNIPATLHIRPMTGRDEQYLGTQRMAKGNTATNMILQSCIREKINVSKLLIEDRTYLLIYLRGISYTNLYDVSIKCPECGASFEDSINLASLALNKCADDFTTEQLCGILPSSGYNFTYRLPTGEDEVEISEYRQRHLKQFPDGLDYTFLYRASLLLTSIGNHNVQITERSAIKTLLSQMLVSDVNYLRNILNDSPFGVDINVEIICKSCISPFDMSLPMELSFFFPKNKKVEV